MSNQITNRTIFGHCISKVHCYDESLYRSTEILENLERIFNSLDESKILENQIGRGVSTFNYPQHRMLDINGIEPLKKWMTERILEVADFYGHPGASTIEVYRSFANKMWPGSSGNIHAHGKEGHGVALFYFQQPKNGSDLVLVNNSFTGDTLDNHPAEDLYYMNVTQGDLVIHDTTLPHGVSLHKGDSPRIVLVFEYIYV